MAWLVVLGGRERDGKRERASGKEKRGRRSRGREMGAEAGAGAGRGMMQRSRGGGRTCEVGAYALSIPAPRFVEGRGVRFSNVGRVIRERAGVYSSGCEICSARIRMA